MLWVSPRELRHPRLFPFSLKVPDFRAFHGISVLFCRIGDYATQQEAIKLFVSDISHWHLPEGGCFTNIFMPETLPRLFPLPCRGARAGTAAAELEFQLCLSCFPPLTADFWPALVALPAPGNPSWVEARRTANSVWDLASRSTRGVPELPGSEDHKVFQQLQAGQSSGSGVAKASPSVCCVPVLETFCVVGNSWREGSALFLGCLCSPPPQPKQGLDPVGRRSHVWRALGSSRPRRSSRPAPTRGDFEPLAQACMEQEPLSLLISCSALLRPEIAARLWLSSAHGAVPLQLSSSWAVSPAEPSDPRDFSVPCVSGGRGWPPCRGCVPGCCCCPCSAPPPSAKGPKVSAAFVCLPSTSAWCCPTGPCKSPRAVPRAFPPVRRPPSTWGSSLANPAAVFLLFLLNNPTEPLLAPPGMGAALPLLTLFFSCILPPPQITPVCRAGQGAALSASEWTRSAPSAPKR